MRIDPRKWPELKKAWDEYGHAIPFEELDGLKTDSRLCYVVVRWTARPEGEAPYVLMADLARAGTREPWEFQNDEIGPITEADWKKLRVVPDCDWFEIPGNPDFR